MQMLINDANILIDIEAADLVEKIFKLPFTFCMPDMLYHDELGDTYAHFLKHGLHLLELSAQSILFTMELDQKYKKTKPVRLPDTSLGGSRKLPSAYRRSGITQGRRGNEYYRARNDLARGKDDRTWTTD
jgi:hypothetical protein